MINSLKVALLNCATKTEHLEPHVLWCHQVRSPKDLVRLLIEKEIDLIVVDGTKSESDKWQKISQSYCVPFLIYGKPKDFPGMAEHCIGFIGSRENLEETLKAGTEKVLRFRSQREVMQVQFTLDSVTSFTDRVMHTTKDLFISDVKNYFRNQFKMENCHWVSVRSTSSKLPAILKLKHELENQKVDQGGLIKDLDDCATEIVNTKDFQIWKTTRGDYLCMLWVHEDENSSHCVILNKVQIKKRTAFEQYLATLIPFLNRRWSLCLTVGEAQSQVYKDSLTSLYNQKFLTEVVDRKIEEYKRYKTPFSILFIDVDHFKRVNDSLGHVVGSAVLQQVGDLLKGQIRTSDFAFRYGGDEFIILLSHTEGEDAVNVAERIRKEVEISEFAVNGLKVRITISIGLAFFPIHADSAEDIIRIADEAMYYGKHKSRNIVYKAG